MRRVPKKRPDATKPEHDTTNRSLLNHPAADEPKEPPVIQTKLVVGSVEDPAEFEADRVADEFVTWVRRRVRDDAPVPGASSAASPVGEGPSGPRAGRIRRSAETPTGPVGLDGGATDAGTEAAIRNAPSGQALPERLRETMETYFQTDLSQARVHTDSRSNTLNQRLSSQAFTLGSDIFFRRNQYDPASETGQRLIAHEVAHTIQQRSAGSTARRVVRRRAGDYSRLNQMNKAVVDADSEAAYARATDEFECRMGPFLSERSEAHSVADKMLVSLHNIVKAWAESTGQQLRDVYVADFRWAQGEKYYGAFEMTAKNVGKVFDDKSEPLRKKLKLVYNSVRNNNLQKYLKMAALELDEVARTGSSRAHTVYEQRDDKDPVHTEQTVKPGFAKKSGLSGVLGKEPGRVADVAAIAEQERRTFDTASKTRQDPGAGATTSEFVVGHDTYSDLFKQKDQLREANKDREFGVNANVALAEQRTLRVKDVPDLTSAEIRHMKKQDMLAAGQAVPIGEKLKKRDKERFKKEQADTKIKWEQGSEGIEVIPNSFVAQEADKIKARLEAGISGSTDLMLNAAKWLGVDTPDDLKKLRLGLIGWMLANRDHSFYEIMKSAENFGLPFITDATNPGIEYERAENFAPMPVRALEKIAPGGKFPRHFLSVPYKDELAEAKAQDQHAGRPGQSIAEYRAFLTQMGLPAGTVNQLDERSAVELRNLYFAVERELMTSGDVAKNKLAFRRIRSTPPFVYLVRRFPVHADLMLAEIVRKKWGPTALVEAYADVRASDRAGALPAANQSTKQLSDAVVSDLAQKGVPRMYLTELTDPAIFEVAKLSAMIAGLPLVGQPAAIGANQYHLGTVWNSLTLAKVTNQLNNPRRAELIFAVLVHHHHPNAPGLNPDHLWLVRAAGPLADRLESGGKTLSVAQLNNLAEPPQIQGATAAARKERYWATTQALQQLWENTFRSIQEAVTAADVGQQTAVLNAARSALSGGALNAFEADRTAHGLGYAVYAQLAANRLAWETVWFVVPADVQNSLTSLFALHPKELGAIYQYTTKLFRPIVASTTGLSAADFSDTDLTNLPDSDAGWGSPLGTLQYSLPQLEALKSAMQKLPLWTKDVFRIQDTGRQLLNKTDAERLETGRAMNKVGSIQTFDYVTSAAKSTSSQYINDNYGRMDRVFVMQNIKSGHDIQGASQYYAEMEVLFAPGARFRVTSLDSRDKHLWVYMEEV